ncbi:MAG TPA: 23S rRNA (adenine(2503)-C(2))-methyltransferase RlmN [Vicinamibacterales bacterium]|nr:23S rRNA (adenine(2503)-C(2))-methyltransferase RlmN [Vicinamibacterales bacterium]
MSDPRPDLAALELTSLEELFRREGIDAFHARQVYRWIHRRGHRSFDGMTDVSAALRQRLASTARLETPVIETRQVSVDGTRKFLLRLGDDRRVEAVFIPDTPAMTFCISSQVGCAMDCAFCLTGRMGFVRNLTAGEIVGQVRALAAELGMLDERFNIVLMGMGEPLHNYDAVMQAVRMLVNEHGFAMNPRRITLSTVGLVPAIVRLAKETVMPNLAISLHGTTDEQRNALVPVNRKYSLAALIDACRQVPLRRRDRITFEYVLLDGVNDTPADARRLVKLLSDLRAKVNLIPLNPAPGIPFERPSDDRIDRFAQALAERGMTVSVRKSRGRDIRAACGQLIVEGQKRSPAQRAATLMPA